MNKVQQTTVAVHIRKPGYQILREEKILSRSRLYSLVPYEIGTIWRESLTGYINRLGWTHHVSPRALVGEMIVPQLDEHLRLTFPSIAMFGAHGAMSLNGAGDVASTGIAVLKQLTMRTDLHCLTLPWWVGDLPRRRQLRETPAWCPLCLSEWRTKGHPLYQPLFWMFQIVTICPHHRTCLIDRCPRCQKRQMILATNKTQSGECTSCALWLGATAESFAHQMDDEQNIAWQKWVMGVLEELLTTTLAQGPIQWESFFKQSASSLKEQKAYSKLARFTEINRQTLHQWVNGNDTYTPTLQTILKFCYVCKVTPLQVMRKQLDHLQQIIEHGTDLQPPLPRRPLHRVDRERCQALLQAVLDGREEPLGVYPIARRLGYAASSLQYHFPQECAEITQRAKAYRKQRGEQRHIWLGEQVRQVSIAVHALGNYPSQDAVQSLLPHGVMRMPEARAIWKTTLRELGFEP